MKLEELVKKELKHLQKEIEVRSECKKYDIDTIEEVFEAFYNKSEWYANSTILHYEANKEVYRVLTGHEYKPRIISEDNYKNYIELIEKQYSLFQDFFN